MENLYTEQRESGFTLVELAIVLMIIGLLIGGILRGQELMENARVSSTVQQVTAYSGAYHTFRDAYSALPGDMPTALNRIPGCAAATSFCNNGNGNSRIGDGGSPAANQAGTVALPNAETTYFWKHLALAHLISGVRPTGNPVTPAWGDTHPAAKIGGGFTIFYSNTANDWGIGHVLQLQLDPNNKPAAAVGQRGNMAVSPIRARQIDRKMDDGLTDTGSVTADYVVTGCEVNINGVSQYENLEEKNCTMFFQLE